MVLALGFLPGLTTVPPLDRDEPRYTQATKQMVETGDYVSIRFQDAPRNKKPIGIHWLQAGAVWLSGAGADAPLWVYRLPSLLGAIAAMALAAWTARAFLPLGPSLIVGALLGATIILGVEARLAKTDAVLLATVLAAQGALARIWLAPVRGLAMPAVFWVALALGILVKGPIAPMVCGLTLAVLAVLSGRSVLSRVRPLLGLLIVAAICLPWFVAIWQATDGAFFANALGRDFLGKAAGGQEGHWAPPLTHLALFFAVGWPLAPFALGAAWLWLKARGPVFLFAAAWAIPSWIVFELTPTKLPHYTLPLVPALALATVAVLLAREPPRALRLIVGAMVLLVPLGAVLATLALPFAVPVPSADPTMADVYARLLDPTMLFAVLPAVAGIVAGLAIWRGAPLLSGAVLAPTLAAAVTAQAFIWGIVLPQLSAIWISPRLVAAAEAVAPCARPRLVSVGYNEPSMIFLAGTDTALASAEDAVAATEGTCAVIAARADAVARVEAEARRTGVDLRRAGTIEGFNISKGDPVTLSLYVRGDANR